MLNHIVFNREQAMIENYFKNLSNNLQEAYEEAGFTLVERMTMKEWNCFVMKKDVE